MTLQADMPEGADGAGQIDPETNTEGQSIAVEPGTVANAGEAGAELGAEAPAGEDGEEVEVVLRFGDEEPLSSTSDPERDNSAMREARKHIAELNRKIREFEAKEKSNAQPEVAKPIVLGAKPKLEDFDYDEAKHDEALDKWYAEKRKFDEQQAQQQAAERARQEAQQARVTKYHEGIKALPVKDFKEAEDEVVGALSVEQQGILLLGAEKPELLVYALGRAPHKLKQLANINDPVRFAFAAGKLERELKMTVTPRNAKAAPETRLTSSSSAPSGGSNAKLERLRAEAERTGDYSKVLDFKRQLKQADRRR